MRIKIELTRKEVVDVKITNEIWCGEWKSKIYNWVSEPEINKNMGIDGQIKFFFIAHKYKTDLRIFLLIQSLNIIHLFTNMKKKNLIDKTSYNHK